MTYPFLGLGFNTWAEKFGTVIPGIAYDITYGITNAGGVFNLLSTGAVDYEVEWGDGDVETSTLNTLPHTYVAAGDYELTVNSDGAYTPYFNNAVDRLQITSVAIGSGADLGTDLTRSWYNASNMTTFTCSFDVTSSVTILYATWFGCNSLTSFPLIDTSSVTTFYGTWYNCSSLTSFPRIDTSSGTTFFTAWRNCTSLTSFPSLDTSSVTNFYFTWFYCSSLTSFPLLNTSSGTNIAYAWYGCSSINNIGVVPGATTSFPLIDTSSVTNFSGAWNECSSLTIFPSLDTSSGTEFYSTWGWCTSLTSFPSLDLSGGTNFNTAWYRCIILTDFPANMFDTTGTLIVSAFTSTWTDCALTTQSIENILVSLDTNGATGITLGIEGGDNAPRYTGSSGTNLNWSAAAETAYNNLDAKGWTINYKDYDN